MAYHHRSHTRYVAMTEKPSPILPQAQVPVQDREQQRQWEIEKAQLLDTIRRQERHANQLVRRFKLLQRTLAEQQSVLDRYQRALLDSGCVLPEVEVDDRPDHTEMQAVGPENPVLPDEQEQEQERGPDQASKHRKRVSSDRLDHNSRQRPLLTEKGGERGNAENIQDGWMRRTQRPARPRPTNPATSPVPEDIDCGFWTNRKVDFDHEQNPESGAPSSRRPPMQSTSRSTWKAPPTKSAVKSTWKSIQRRGMDPTTTATATATDTTIDTNAVASVTPKRKRRRSDTKTTDVIEPVVRTAGAARPGLGPGPGRDPALFPYVEVVRNRAERAALPAHDCVECRRYYAALNGLVSEADMAHHRANCSRHRARFEPYNTPDDFWRLSFPDSEPGPA